MILLQICYALKQSISTGIAHRDIKLAQLILNEKYNCILLADWGEAVEV